MILAIASIELPLKKIIFATSYSSVLTLLLPETKGRVLPDTIQAYSMNPALNIIINININNNINININIRNNININIHKNLYQYEWQEGERFCSEGNLQCFQKKKTVDKN